MKKLRGLEPRGAAITYALCSRSLLTARSHHSALSTRTALRVTPVRVNCNYSQWCESAPPCSIYNHDGVTEPSKPFCSLQSQTCAGYLMPESSSTVQKVHPSLQIKQVVAATHNHHFEKVLRVCFVSLPALNGFFFISFHSRSNFISRHFIVFTDNF